MKKVFKFILCIIGFSLLLLILVLGNRRSIDAKVIEVNGKEVVFEDETKNLWSINTENVFLKDEKVKLTFNDKGTDFLEDDEIIKIKREGKK